MYETNTDVRSSSSLEPCGSDDHDDCGIRLILDRLGERWTVMALAELSVGPRRYRELERALEGISQRMMTLTLRRMERDGYVLRHVEKTIPPKVTYELSELGRSFAAQVAMLVGWTRQNKSVIERAQVNFDAQLEKKE
ncbi:winged helix-turn-helix transcriptional regulator [Paracoccus aerodenitrificans]|uniref:winged helix-turn-helix transcriptional regulator n=1 Tax=Paracoccus aerodenitrificans TaxID=3017781 RepID=UPI0022F09E70|nr:helix-turn-helix domain-containing protein [Paracoccus aerodenitrificans]WBU64597.1 helix-turn-helix domain-containing protein [Paracoccus aerodenitrificans]